MTWPLLPHAPFSAVYSIYRPSLPNISLILLFSKQYCNMLHFQLIKRYKESIPFAGLWGPEGSGRLRLPDSMTLALEGGKLSALCTGCLYLQKYPGTHFKRPSQPWAHGIVGCHGKNPQ
jgi:hypothetical protein